MLPTPGSRRRRRRPRLPAIAVPAASARAQGAGGQRRHAHRPERSPPRRGSRRPFLRIGNDHRRPARRGPDPHLRAHLPRFQGERTDRGRSVRARRRAAGRREADRLRRSEQRRWPGENPPVGPGGRARWPRRAIASPRASRSSRWAATTATIRPRCTAACLPWTSSSGRPICKSRASRSRDAAAAASSPATAWWWASAMRPTATIMPATARPAHHPCGNGSGRRRLRLQGGAQGNMVAGAAGCRRTSGRAAGRGGSEGGRP